MAKKEIDHILPKAEGGGEEPWNKRKISQKENRRKGTEMPKLSDVADSSEPVRLAVEIDKVSLKDFKHPRNKNKGFGGLPLR
jgi:5-methylcytosine-specific restriction endonuclease McrA